jgi:hypothetical protein
MLSPTSRNQTTTTSHLVREELSTLKDSNETSPISVSFISPDKKRKREKMQSDKKIMNIETPPRSPYKTPPTKGDRFIPQRTRDTELVHFYLTNPVDKMCRSMLDTTPPKERYKQEVAKMLFPESPTSILCFGQSNFKSSTSSSTSSTNPFDNCFKVVCFHFALNSTIFVCIS